MAGARLFRWFSRTLDWILRLDFGFLLGWFLKGVGVLSVWYLAVITWLGVASPHPDGARATLLEFVKQWRVSVPVVLASILVTFNFGDKILRLRRREDEHDERADYEEMALHELRKRLQVKKKATDWKTAWEPSG